MRERPNCVGRGVYSISPRNKIKGGEVPASARLDKVSTSDSAGAQLSPSVFQMPAECGLEGFRLFDRHDVERPQLLLDPSAVVTHQRVRHLEPRRRLQL